MLLLGLFVFLAQSLSPDAIEHAQAGSAAQQQGNFDVAIKEFSKVVELQPDLASGYANLGDAWFRKGDYTRAIPILQHALELSSDLKATHQILGVALLIQGDPAGALPHLEKAPVPELLGLAYLETGRVVNAVAALQTALKSQPDNPDVLYYFGRAASLASRQALRDLGGKHPLPDTQPGKVPIPDLAALLTSLMEKPTDPERLDQFAKAASLASQRAFDLVLEKHADSARAHQIAAERYTEQLKIPEAEREYAASLALQPYTGGVHLAFGRLLAQAGDLPHAITEFRLETKIRPASSEAFYYEGAALLQTGKAQEAVTELTQADRLSPNAPPILFALGNAAAAAGDVPQAEKVFAKVLDTDKSGNLASQARAALEKLKGKP